MKTESETSHRTGFSNRKWKILGLFLVTIVVIAVLLLEAHFTGQDDTSHKFVPIYSPGDFGLPDTIAGYRVVAVLTSDTTACMRPNAARVLLQAGADDNPSTFNIDGVRQTLDALDRADVTDWELDFMGGPGISLERIAANNLRWNNEFMDHDCFRTGGPIRV